MVDAALHRASDLRSGAECVFVVYQKLCQVIVPQIPGKSVHSSHLHQASCHMEKFFLPVFKAFFFCLIAVHQ